MPFDISRFKGENRKEKSFNLKGFLKNTFKIAGYIAIILLLLFLLLVLGANICNKYSRNHLYSVAMPFIPGDFEYDKKTDTVIINGLAKIANEETASLGIIRLFCSMNSKECSEERAAVINLGDNVNIYAYHSEYKITYSDKNKVVFKNDSGATTGVIDLNTKTLEFTTAQTDKARKIEVLTNSKQIQKLEKRIIKKYLKI